MEWISVKERLPEPGVEVLCWMGTYHWIGKRDLNPDLGWTGDAYDDHHMPVMYWMPLPESPTKEKSS